MMPQKAIKVEFSAQPWQLTMSSRKNFRISITATNRGGTTIDPELHRAKLFVNGNEAHVWNLAIGNGKREAKWSALGPAETVSMTWSSMGEALLPAPGVYRLSLRFDETEPAPIDVEVHAG